MKEGDYKILITVYEANDLEPKPAEFLFFDLNKSACDAFVEIDIRGEIRKTAVAMLWFRCVNRQTILFGKNLFTINLQIWRFKTLTIPR